MSMLYYRNPKPRYTMSRSDKGIITCFPSDMDTSDLVEVSTVASMFAKFGSTNFMREYDCEVYYNQMIDELND